MKDFQYITNSHPSYIENLYHDFVKDPESVDEDMRKFFEGFDFAVANGNTEAPAQAGGLKDVPANLEKEFAVYRLISGYRKKGHLIADTNPIRQRKDRHANLEPVSYTHLDVYKRQKENYHNPGRKHIALNGSVS